MNREHYASVAAAAYDEGYNDGFDSGRRKGEANSSLEWEQILCDIGRSLGVAEPTYTTIVGFVPSVEQITKAIQELQQRIGKL